jgi:HD-GYP domain-containing protein (c-di-GMP phosphodiesterase class II)
MPVKKISSTEVEIGMYVSSLDRPWGETTFLFQGFPVQKQSEIEELQNTCSHVYIMSPDEEIVLDNNHPYSQPEPFSHDEIGRISYEVTKTAEKELRTARQSHEELSQIMEEIESTLQDDKELNIQKMERSVEVMVDSIERNPDAYIWLTRMKKFDSHIYKDSLSASVWATTLGRELGLEREKLSALATGTLCMDIGKTALPINILNKSSRLSDDEWALMKSHVEHGLRILSDTTDLSADVLDIVRTHHERLDGSGYPSALRHNEIPLLGQIAGIVDFYVAVTTPRPYAEAISSSNAIHMLYLQKGRYFSDILVDKFIQALSTYPTGSLVELSSGEVGVVISQNPGLRLRPNVVLLLDLDKKPYVSNPVVSLVDYTHRDLNNQINIKKTLADGEYGLKIEELSF